jgi:hypothetical protein
MSRATYLPFPLIPLRGTVRAFAHRSRLGLSVAPPFGFGVPHYRRRLHDLLCPLLAYDLCVWLLLRRLLLRGCRAQLITEFLGLGG